MLCYDVPMAKLLDGREIAAYIKERHFNQVRSLGAAPRLAIVHATDDPATRIYVRTKQRYGADIGVEVLEVAVTAGEIAPTIQRLNADPGTGGIIVQLPLPGSIDSQAVLESIAASKDVDGLRADTEYDPATPKGIMWLLAAYGVQLKDRLVAVIGRGKLIGVPITRMLEAAGAKVTGCNRTTPDLKAQTLKADILVVATGQKYLLTPDMVKPGAIVIDCGSPDPEIDPALFEDESLMLTPNPGGVGPMTVAALFDNLLIAASKSASARE